MAVGSRVRHRDKNPTLVDLPQPCPPNTCFAGEQNYTWTLNLTNASWLANFLGGNARLSLVGSMGLSQARVALEGLELGCGPRSLPPPHPKTRSGCVVFGGYPVGFWESERDTTHFR